MGWEIATWRYVHKSHGTFFISMFEGKARASRVFHEQGETPEYEAIGEFACVGSAMASVDARMRELDAALLSLVLPSEERVA